MTILPKKKQQQQNQQQQQDGRHQQHGGGNIGNVGRGIDDSSGIPNTNIGNSLLNSSSNVVVTSGSTALNSSTSSFLSTSSTGTVSALASAHYAGDVATNHGIMSGPGVGGNIGVRRQGYGTSHDSGEAGDSGVLIGPHRKRPASGIGCPQSNTLGMGISTSTRNSQSDRSSPYRTTRRSNRISGNSCANVGSGTSLLATSVPCPATSMPSNASIYNNSGVIPVGAASANHGRSNVPSPEIRDHEGYNSEDEYDDSARYEKAPGMSEEIERKFEEKLLATKGFKIKQMKEDGACLFRAVADQVYGDEEMHGVVRKLCMDYIAKNADYFKQFLTEDFASYVERKREDTAHGNHVEIQAMAELFNRPIQVYQYSCDPINTFHSTQKSDIPAIRVSYHGNVHYNSVVDPYAATIGVGLGLPQFYPGLAEKNLMKDAVHASEKHAIEEAMLQDKLRATDWEATDEQLQEQVARESYLQWLRDQEKQMKENANTRDGVSTATANAGGSHFVEYSRPSCSKSPNRMHHNETSESASGSVAGSSHYYGSKDWEEDDLLNRVLAISQQEYFESFKNQRHDDAADAKNPPS